MKKKLVIILSIFTISLSACGKDKTEDIVEETAAPSDVEEVLSQTEPPSPKNEISTVVWGCNENDEEDLIKVAAAFEKKFKNIRVAVRPNDIARTEFNEYMTRLALADMFPDAMTVYGSLPQYVSKGWVRDLTKFTENDFEFQSIPNVLRQNYYYEGSLFALPQDVTFVALKQTAYDFNPGDMSFSPWTDETFFALGQRAVELGFNLLGDVKGLAFLSPAMFSVDGSVGFIGYNEDERFFDFTSGAWANSVEFLNNLRYAKDLVQNPTAVVTDSGTTVDASKVLFEVTEVNNFYAAGSFLGIPSVNGGCLPLKTGFCVMFNNIRQPDANAVFEFMKFLSYGDDGIFEREKIAIAKGKAFLPVYMSGRTASLIENSSKFNHAIFAMYSQISDGFRVDLENFVPNFAEIRDRYYLSAFENVLSLNSTAPVTSKDLTSKVNGALSDATDALKARIELIRQSE